LIAVTVVLVYLFERHKQVAS